MSQTEGEPLPELATAAHGNSDGIVDALLAATADLDVDARLVAPDEWEHGSARSVCERRSLTTTKAVIEFGQDVEEGFIGLVEHQLATSDFVCTERVPLTARGNETTLMITEVRHDD